ncbi:ABC transporter permease subunit [Hespellia stercorisuis]|uniref:ABC-2 type transport system permease protein n=1 Tax=Hespellia stercorisuis DSM 15480 TaxID=1121950 RepID=A0A1M6U052_9FIRM|nr:ABC transporter permease subunit [Hespellia stercorisuis]SHK62504.1 ABC-2 type transport system permease protein [Hespellia stercorisuis DSM 15480]
MNLTLYKKEWKANWILLAIFMAVLTMYATMIIAMFDPKMGDSLQEMAASMPEVFAAFGMADVGQTLLEFTTGYLYGILLTAFPAVYIIILSNRLVARYVDNGSMVYLLAAPDKRGKIVGTQMIFLVTSLLLMLVYVSGVILATAHLLFPGEMDIPGFLRVNAGLFGLWIMVGGVCFLSSCVFNESKMAVGISSAFVVYSLLVQMISQVGEKFEGLKYATPMTLYAVDGLIAKDGQAWLTCAIMYGVGILCFAAGIAVFRKKNLPI